MLWRDGLHVHHGHTRECQSGKLALTVGASGTFNGRLTPVTVDEMDEICNTDIGEFTLPGQ